MSAKCVECSTYDLDEALCGWCVGDLRTQLAASSAREARLREELHGLHINANRILDVYPRDARGTYYDDLKRSVALAGAALADPPRPVEGPPCGLCGKPAAGYAVADDVRLCHPDDPEAPDCYTLWTLYKQRPAPARGCLLFWAQTCPCAACNARRAAPAPRYTREDLSVRTGPGPCAVKGEPCENCVPDCYIPAEDLPRFSTKEVGRAIEEATGPGDRAHVPAFWAALTPNETTPRADDGKEGGK